MLLEVDLELMIHRFEDLFVLEEAIEELLKAHTA